MAVGNLVDILRTPTSVTYNTLIRVPSTSNLCLCLLHGPPRRPAEALRGQTIRPGQRQSARIVSNPQRVALIPGEGDRPPKRNLNQPHPQTAVGQNLSAYHPITPWRPNGRMATFSSFSQVPRAMALRFSTTTMTLRPSRRLTAPSLYLLLLNGRATDINVPIIRFVFTKLLKCEAFR